MDVARLHYDLPPDRIAQQPVEPRDHARLMVIHRESGTIEHRHFYDIGTYLRAGDCLVVNNTRVIPARFFCKRSTGGRIEGLFLRRDDAGAWRVLLKPSVRLKVGESLTLAPRDSNQATSHAAPWTNQSLRIEAKLDRGEWLVHSDPPIEFLPFLDQFGETPLPPYIERSATPGPTDQQRYQTVYAATPGAVAAPTAGLHFTPALLESLASAGIRRTEVTLHVGLGTFAPVTVSDLRQHAMHAEWYSIQAQAARTIAQARNAGGRIVAVGTTSARSLESLPRLSDPAAQALEQSGIADWTTLLILPPYQFKNVDLLITNFHLPGSTLLALIMALAGEDLIRRAYAEAIAQNYRFFSYGDAMLIA